MEYGQTAYNRIVYVPPPFGGYRVTQNRSRRKRLCAVLLHLHLGQGTFATQSPITCPKRRQPGTLCEGRTKALNCYLKLNYFLDNLI